MIELISHIIYPLADKYLRGATPQQAISRIVDLYNDIVEELLEYKKALIQLDSIVPNKDNYYTKEEIQQNVISRIEEIILQFGTFATKSDVARVLTSYISKEDIAEVLEAYAKTEDTQEKLVSGTNIKTIFGNSVLGEGDVSLPIAATNKLGGIKLYNNNGNNRSGLVIQQDGSIYVNVSSGYGLSRTGDGKVIANIRRSASTDDIDTFDGNNPVDVAAITPANLKYVATKINAYYITYGALDSLVENAAGARYVGRVVVCVYEDIENTELYYLTCNKFDSDTGEMFFSCVVNNTLYYCSVAPGESWTSIQTLNLYTSSQGAMNLIQVPTHTDSLSPAINTYYRFSEPLSELDVTCPTITDNAHVASFVLFFTVVSNDDIMLKFRNVPNNIYAPEDFQFKPGHTYEVTAKFNGVDWILSIVTVGDAI